MLTLKRRPSVWCYIFLMRPEWMIVVPSANFIFSDEVHYVSFSPRINSLYLFIAMAGIYAPNDLCPGLNASIVWLVLHILSGYLTFSYNFIYWQTELCVFWWLFTNSFYQLILMTLRDAYHKERACHKRSILDISAEWRTVVYQMMSCTVSWPQDAVL